jgi:hypothetical protein
MNFFFFYREVEINFIPKYKKNDRKSASGAFKAHQTREFIRQSRRGTCMCDTLTARGKRSPQI